MGSSMKEEVLSSLSLNHSEKSHFVDSQWKLPSWAYPLWRLFWCVWHITWLIVSGVRTQNTAPDDKDGVKWFVYASNWTFLLTTFFCLLDFVLVITAVRRRSRDSDSNNTEQTENPTIEDKADILFQGEFTLVEGIKTPSTPFPTKLQWSLFEAVNCTNLLTTIAFWASQHKDGDTIHADIVVFNIINTIFVVANTMVTEIPVRVFHFIHPTIFIAIYFLFNLIYYRADGTAIGGSDVTFRPLEWDEVYPTAFTIISGFLLFIPLGHLFFFSLFTLRIYLADKFGNESKHPNSEPGHGTYRKRESTGRIENGAPSQNNIRLEISAQVNEGFEMESDNRR